MQKKIEMANIVLTKITQIFGDVFNILLQPNDVRWFLFWIIR
jgi:hypothetical protein